MKVTIRKKEGEEIVLEIGDSLELDCVDSTVQFDRPVRVELKSESEGRAIVSLPSEIVGQLITLEGNVHLSVLNAEKAIKKYIPKGPHGKIQKEVLEALGAKEQAKSLFEIADQTGLGEKQIYNAITLLVKKNLIGRTEFFEGSRKHYKYYKLGVEAPNPREKKSLEIPVVERRVE